MMDRELRTDVANTIAIVLASLAIGVSVGAHIAPSAPRCYEDEVIMWTGEAHTQCVALDDLGVTR